MSGQNIKWFMIAALVFLVSFLIYWFYISHQLKLSLKKVFTEAFPEKIIVVESAGFPLHWSYVIREKRSELSISKHDGHIENELISEIQSFDRIISPNKPLSVSFSLGLRSVSVNYASDILDQLESSGTLQWRMKSSLLLHLSEGNEALSKWLNNIDLMKGVISIDDKKSGLHTEKPISFELRPLNINHWSYNIRGSLNGSLSDVLSNYSEVDPIKITLFKSLWHDPPTNTAIDANGVFYFDEAMKVKTIRQFLSLVVEGVYKKWDHNLEIRNSGEVLRFYGQMHNVQLRNEWFWPTQSELHFDIHTSQIHSNGSVIWDGLSQQSKTHLMVDLFAVSDFSVTQLSHRVYHAFLEAFPQWDSLISLDLTDQLEGDLALESSVFLLLENGYIYPSKIEKGEVNIAWLFDKSARWTVSGRIEEMDREGIKQASLSTAGTWSKKWQPFLNERLQILREMPLALRSQLSELNGLTWDMGFSFADVQWDLQHGLPREFLLNGEIGDWRFHFHGNDFEMKANQAIIDEFELSLKGPLNETVGQRINQWVESQKMGDRIVQWKDLWESNGFLDMDVRGRGLQWQNHSLNLNNGGTNFDLSHDNWGTVKGSAQIDRLEKEKLGLFAIDSQGRLKKEGVSSIMGILAVLDDDALTDFERFGDDVSFHIDQKVESLSWTSGFDLLDIDGDVNLEMPGFQASMEGRLQDARWSEDTKVTSAVMNVNGSVDRNIQQWFLSHFLDTNGAREWNDFVKNFTLSGRFDISNLDTSSQTLLEYGEFDLHASQPNGLGEMNGQWQIKNVKKDSMDRMVIDEFNVHVNPMLIKELFRWAEEKSLLLPPLSSWFYDEQNNLPAMNLNLQKTEINDLSMRGVGSVTGAWSLDSPNLDLLMRASSQGVRFGDEVLINHMDMEQFELKVGPFWSPVMKEILPSMLAFEISNQFLDQGFGSIEGGGSFSGFDRSAMGHREQVWLDTLDGFLNWSHSWGDATFDVEATGLNRNSNEHMKLEATWVQNESTREIDWSKMGQLEWLGHFTPLLNNKKWTFHTDWHEFNTKETFLGKGVTQLSIRGDGLDGTLSWDAKKLDSTFWKSAVFRGDITASDEFRKDIATSIDAFWSKHQLPMSYEMEKIWQTWKNRNQAIKGSINIKIEGLDVENKSIDNINITDKTNETMANNNIEMVNFDHEGFEHLKLKLHHDGDVAFVAPSLVGWTLWKWMTIDDLLAIQEKQHERVVQFMNLALTQMDIELVMSQAFRAHPHRLVLDGDGYVSGPLVDLHIVSEKRADRVGWLTLDGVLKKGFSDWNNDITREFSDIELLLERFSQALPISFKLDANATSIQKEDLKSLHLSMGSSEGGAIKFEYYENDKKLGLTRPEYWMPAVGEFYISQIESCSLFQKTQVKYRWLQLIEALKMVEEPISLYSEEVDYQWMKIKEITDDCMQ